MAFSFLSQYKENNPMAISDMRNEIKGLLESGMSVSAYARQESWDIQTASNALSIVSSLVNSEAEEPEDMALLEKIMDGLLEFIQSEKEEMMGAARGDMEEGYDEEGKSMKAIEKRKDVDTADKKRAVEKYGNVEFADEKNKKYALGTKDEIEAAWRYIGMEKNQKKYSPEEVDAIKKRIVAAWKKKIDKDGPPSAKEDEEKKSMKDFDHSHEHTHADGTTHKHEHSHTGDEEDMDEDHADMMHKHEHPEDEEDDEPNDNPKSWDSMLVAYGEAVKALEDGTVQGYLVRFSSDKDPDLTGDFFTKSTNFGDAKESYAWYHHKLPLKSDKGALLPAYTKQLGKKKAEITTDDVGVFVKLSLDMRDEYEKAIYEMAKAGKLGWSSGTAPNLVEREPVGKAWHIKTWPLGLDASLTPKPAEFRNIVSIKSLAPKAALPDTGVSKNFYKEINMEKNDFDAAVKSAVANALAEQKAEADALKAKEQEKQNAVEEGYKMAVKDMQMGKAPAFNVIPTSADPDHRNGGVDGFRHWVKTGQVNGELIPASGWDTQGTKAAFNVNDGSTGAFMVPDILYGIIQPKRDLISWVRQAPVQHLQTPADHLLIPVEGTKMTAFTQTNEQGTYNEDEGTVEQLDVHVYKFTKEVQMTEEFINYNQTNFDAWLANKLARAEAVTENTKFSVGTGGATVQGVVTGASTGNTIATSATIVPADLTTLIGKLGAGYNVQGETGFLMANVTNWYLRSVQTSGFFAYTQTPAAQGTNAAGYNFGPIANQGAYGLPSYICDDLAAYTDTTGTLAKTPIIFGNWVYYAVVERPGMMLQRNPYLHMNQGIVSLFASIYRGGGVLQQEAFYGLITK